MKSKYEIVADSLMMALQDLDDPELDDKELDRRVKVAKAKATVASAFANYQKSLIEAERLRIDAGESVCAETMVGESSDRIGQDNGKRLKIAY